MVAKANIRHEFFERDAMPVDDIRYTRQGGWFVSQRYVCWTAAVVVMLLAGTAVVVFELAKYSLKVARFLPQSVVYRSITIVFVSPPPPTNTNQTV